MCQRRHRLCVALSFFRFPSQLDFLPLQIKLETASGKFNLEIAVLQEQKSALQHTLNEVREESARKQTMYTSVSASFEKALAQRDEASKRLVQAEERRAVSAEREALEAVKVVNELREQVSGLGAELAEARKRAKENMEPSVEEVEKVNALRVRVAELEGVNATLGQRARGLKRRYKEGDLVSVGSQTDRLFYDLCVVRRTTTRRIS